MLDICIKDNIVDYGDIVSHNFTIGNIQIEPINTHFSSLLHKFKILQKNDFNILYNAFYDILEICGFKFNEKDNNTILYLNIFQKVLDYFKGNKNDLHIKRETIEPISGVDELKDVCKKLDLAFKIRKILCLLLAKTTSSGKGKPLT